MATKTGTIEVLNYKQDRIVGALCIMKSKGSILGNPFYKEARYSAKHRQESIAKFRKHLWAELQKPDSPIQKEIRRLTTVYLKGGNVRLYCCCKPLDCHGDIIANCIRWLAKETRKRQKRHAIACEILTRRNK